MIYKGKNTENISFPLGGIGTGCIGLSGNGELIDFEIFNRPNKSTRNGYTHFAIKTECDGKTDIKILQGDTNENYIGKYDREGWMSGIGYGPKTNSMAGYPHFKNVVFKGEFPIAKLTFKEENFGAKCVLTAFNPFIPHDSFNSSIPCAMFIWEVENVNQKETEFTLAFSMQNPNPVSVNKQVEGGIFFTCGDKNENEIGYSDLCVLTDENADIQTYWYRGGWQDSVTTYYKNLQDGNLQNREYENSGRYDHGTIYVKCKLQPKEKKKIKFVLAWNTPNQYNYWHEYKNEKGEDITWKNYYALPFKNSYESCKYALRNFDMLLSKTEQFKNAIFKSTLPSYIIDAISSNLSVLKSPTVLRYEDGSFWAWEGVMQTHGSCDGSCQHVWNYAYALPFLFPELERSLRENTLKYGLRDTGSTDFRIDLPLGRERKEFRACVDGHFGEVIKCYREWKISGDTKWLKSYSDKIFKMIDFAWSPENVDKWDLNKDGVLEGRQHHTLDMELFGPSSWLQGFYLLALYCGSKIAEAVGDTKRADTYRSLYEKGKKWTNENLFNGKYFYHKIDLKDKSIIDGYEYTGGYWNEETEEIKYQVANGSIIDQMLSDFHSNLIGLEGIFDKDKKQTALEYLYKNNFKKSMRDVTNMWRNFALNDEAGTIICSYPENEKTTSIPIPYCEECMTGFEYALAVLMIYEGKKEYGEEMVKAIRDRYDGEKRNPWNEIECGNNYARSMASFGLMNAYSGFTFDMTKKQIGFNPIQNGTYFWSVGETYGTVSINDEKLTLKILGKPLELSSFTVEKCSTVTVDEKDIPFTKTNGKITFNVTVKNKLVIK